MAVDEKIARAWGKLRNQPVQLHLPDDRHRDGFWWESRTGDRVPDPATQPWEWWPLFAVDGIMLVRADDQWQVCIGYGSESWDWISDWLDTPEAALEAAIRAWEASNVIE